MNHSFLAVTVLLISCSDAGPRIYTAQPYDAEAQCLAEYEAVGLVEAGTLSAACSPTCLEISGTLYVSTVCPPFPDTASALTPEDDAACAAALDAEACE